jgi:hypothetical protein
VRRSSRARAYRLCRNLSTHRSSSRSLQTIDNLSTFSANPSTGVSAVLRILRQTSHEISSRPVRKDIELLRCDFRCPRLLTTKVKDFAFPFQRMQSSHIVPLASAPASCAVPYSTTRDHCGALRTLSPNISNSALNIAPALARASPLGDCACPFPPHRLRVCLRTVVIICAVLAVLSALPIPRSPPRKTGRPAAGVQIITN